MARRRKADNESPRLLTRKDMENSQIVRAELAKIDAFFKKFDTLPPEEQREILGKLFKQYEWPRVTRDMLRKRVGPLPDTTVYANLEELAAKRGRILKEIIQDIQRQNDPEP